MFIPKDYQGQGSGLNDLVKAADELGIEVQYEEKNGTAIAKQVFGTTEKLFGLTERGIAIFAPQLDKLMQKHQNIGNKLGGSAENLGNNLSKAGGVLSTLQNFLGIALSSMELDDLLKNNIKVKMLVRMNWQKQVSSLLTNWWIQQQVLTIILMHFQSKSIN